MSAGLLYRIALPSDRLTAMEYHGRQMHFAVLWSFMHMTRTPTSLALGLTCRMAVGAAGFQLKSEPAFSWASGEKTYLVDKHVTAAGRWVFQNVRNGSYVLAVGNYRGDRVLHVSVDGKHFKTLFDLDGSATPSPVSGGVEQTFGPVQVDDAKLHVYVYHRADEGVARFGSYFDYIRLILDQGTPLLIEAESTIPQVVEDTSGFVIEPPRAGFDGAGLSTGVPTSEVGRIAEEIHRLLWQKFFDRKTHMLYTLPGGGSTEDCSLYGGVYLAALVDKLGVTGDEAVKDECRLILKGLIKNATITVRSVTDKAGLLLNRLPSQQATTDAAGKFRFDSLTPGKHEVTGSAQGFAPLAVQAIDVSEVESNQLSLTFRIGVTVDGVFRGEGKGIPNARLILVPTVQAHRQRRNSARTEPNGSFRFTNIASGAYLVYGPAPSGSAVASRRFRPYARIDVPEEGTLSVLLGGDGSGQRVRCLVKTGDAPAPNVSLNIERAGVNSPVNPIWDTVTDKDGRFELTDMPPGEYTVRKGSSMAQTKEGQELTLTVSPETGEAVTVLSFEEEAQAEEPDDRAE